MKKQLFIIATLMLAIYNNTSAQNGLLDPSFATQGTLANEAFPDPVSQSGVFATATRIYTVLEATDVPIGKMYIRCYFLDGTIDASFGTNGTFVIENISGSNAVMNADQSKIFIVGRSTTWESGIIAFDIASEVYSTHFYPVEANYFDLLYHIAITESDEIILGGHHTNSNTYLGSIRIIKFDENLNVDNTFGDAGSVILPELEGLNGSTYGLHDMEVDHNGNVFLIGALDATHKLIKISSDGVVDASFTEPAALSSYMYFNDIEINASNQLLVLPYISGAQYIIRINNDGSIDNTFANAGVFQIYSPNPDYTISLRKLLVKPNGSVVAIGSYQFYNAGSFEGKCLFEVDATGAINPQFPMVLNNLQYGCGNYLLLQNNTATLQPDGKILSYDFAACYDTETTLYHDNILSRYTDELINSVSDEAYSAFNIYPNPAHDILNFMHNNGENMMNAQIKIYDAMGHLVLSEKITGNTLDIEHLAAGLYSIEIMEKESRNVVKFVKE